MIASRADTAGAVPFSVQQQNPSVAAFGLHFIDGASLRGRREGGLPLTLTGDLIWAYWL
ncbi:MAG: hypothetical protein JXI33_03440 [Candidatus Aminicenantes bacterium]|nr:hypothetical protein [Candidatus Aminicenantes bacterium]